MLTLKQFLNAYNEVIYDNNTILGPLDCPYDIAFTPEAIEEYASYYVLGFKTEANDDGEIVFTYIEVGIDG
jgi:hypothetical protein